MTFMPYASHPDRPRLGFCAVRHLSVLVDRFVRGRLRRAVDGEIWPVNRTPACRPAKPRPATRRSGSATPDLDAERAAYAWDAVTAALGNHPHFICAVLEQPSFRPLNIDTSTALTRTGNAYILTLTARYRPGLPVGLGEATHVTNPVFDPKLPGSWLVDLSHVNLSKVKAARSR